MRYEDPVPTAQNRWPRDEFVSVSGERTLVLSRGLLMVMRSHGGVRRT